MQARLEKIENSEAYLEITVDAETLEKGLEKAYRKVVKQVSIPGFRKGRVPRELLEAHFGKEVLYEDAIEYVIPDTYEKALEEVNIAAITQPEFDIKEIEAGKGMTYTAKVGVKPEVKLGQLEGLEVSVPVFEVTDENVDKRLEEVRARYSKIVEKNEEAAELGDTTTIDFVGYIDDEPFEGGTGENYQLELGSNTFIPGFEEQVVGMKVGETKDIKVTFPEYYHAEDLAGQDAVFKVTVNKIEGKELRELDDEFAQEVSSFDTLAEFKDSIRANLEEMNADNKKNLLKEKVVEKALEQCEVPMADSIIEMQAENMMRQFAARMQMQGLSLEQYFQITNMTPEMFKQQIWPDAEKKAKINFMLEKIVEEKGIEATDEEIDREIEATAKRIGLDVEQTRQNLAGVMDDLIFGIKMDKAVQYLLDNAVITEYQGAEKESLEESQGEVDE